MQRKDMTTRVVGDVVVIDLKGNDCLWGENNVTTLVSELLAQGTTRFLLNLDQVPHVDSAGLSGIVHTYTTVTRRGFKFALLHVQPRVRRVLDLTKFTSVCATYESEEEALKAFATTLPT